VKKKLTTEWAYKDTNKQ